MANILVGNYYAQNRSKTTIRRANKRAPHSMMNDSMDFREPKKFIKFDYLADVRNKKMESDGYGYKENEFWKSEILNPNKSSIDKYLEIKSRAKDLERKAKQKEAHIGHGKPLKNSEEVNSMYMDAIRAKAALLENL